MASQTIQDVKAIYAAAKAKWESLPKDNKFRVHSLLMQCALAASVVLALIIGLLVGQIHAERMATYEAEYAASYQRGVAAHFSREIQRLHKELDSKKP